MPKQSQHHWKKIFPLPDMWILVQISTGTAGTQNTKTSTYLWICAQQSRCLSVLSVLSVPQTSLQRGQNSNNRFAPREIWGTPPTMGQAFHWGKLRMDSEIFLKLHRNGMVY